jgi:DNA repair ATPase RecN
MEITIMKKINIQHEANIDAQGSLNSKHCKPVICLETGDVYSSATDAAEAVGVSLGSMSGHLTGKNKSVKGKHYCYLSRVSESLNSIVTRLREASEMEVKAKMWDEMIAAQEEARKEKERRASAIAKAEAKVAKYAADCAKYQEKFNESMNALDNANKELEALLDADAA